MKRGGSELKADCEKGERSEADTVDTGRQERQATARCVRDLEEEKTVKMIVERCFLTYNDRKRSE